MKFGRKQWLIAAAVVAVGIVAFILASRMAAPQPAAGPAPSYAPKGELVSGFPKELILDDQARINNSYAMAYSASLNQYTAQWTSAQTVGTLCGKYNDYFSGNGWTIVNKSPANPAFCGVYARKDTADANFTVAKAQSGSAVVLSYVVK